MEYLLPLVCLLIGILMGLWMGRTLVKSQSQTLISAIENEKARLTSQLEMWQKQMNSDRSQYQEELQKSRSELERIRQEKEQAVLHNSRLSSEYSHLLRKQQEQKLEMEQLQEKFTKDFENLANRILEEKSNKFTAQNQQNLASLLNPLQEKILLFEKKVENTHKESIDYHAALRQQIVNLQEMNQQMSRETLNLTRALKGDNKMQGNWGELILERVLEKSGLEKGREYEVQQSFTNDQGQRVLPDVVVHLPDGKKMVIDSKVSLVAYEKLVNEDNEPLRTSHLKEHTASIKRHIDQLSAKNYQDLYSMESPDFVLLFIPIEPAFAAALNEDDSLYSKAFEKNIIIVTPTTLLATLRTIDSMWTNQKQQQNAYEIARQAGALYDKFEGFVSDLTRVGKKIDESKSEYSAAMNKLFEGNGNLITSVEKLKKMGAKAKKSLPESVLKKLDSGLDAAESNS